MKLKRNIRAVGIDDCPFDKFKDKEVSIIGTVMRGNSLVEGFLKENIVVDGNDVTKAVIKMIKESQFNSQLKTIFTDGVTFGGFNVLDVFEVNSRLNIPVIIIIRNKPNLEKIKSALLKLGKKRELGIIEKMPEAVMFNGIYYQNIGLNREDSEKLIEIFTNSAKIPEPIRISHLIGQMLVYNRSSGHA